ncbi:luciferase domain-containing protein [Streptomyces sp. NPDC001514]
MSVFLSDLFARSGPRPVTTGLSIPHVQLDAHSPPHISAELMARAKALPGVVTGAGRLCETSSLGLRVLKRTGWTNAFLPSAEEFGYIHRSGVMYLTVPADDLGLLIWLGWVELHPATLNADFPDNIVTCYAPRDETELEVATKVLRASYAQALS